MKKMRWIWKIRSGQLFTLYKWQILVLTWLRLRLNSNQQRNCVILLIGVYIADRANQGKILRQFFTYFQKTQPAVVLLHLCTNRGGFLPIQYRRLCANRGGFVPIEAALYKYGRLCTNWGGFMPVEAALCQQRRLCTNRGGFVPIVSSIEAALCQ